MTKQVSRWEGRGGGVVDHMLSELRVVFLPAETQQVAFNEGGNVGMWLIVRDAKVSLKVIFC